MDSERYDQFVYINKARSQECIIVLTYNIYYLYTTHPLKYEPTNVDLICM
jgi:hypothetical protein